MRFLRRGHQHSRDPINRLQPRRWLPLMALSLLSLAGCSHLHDAVPVWGEPSGMQAKAIFLHSSESQDAANLNSPDPAKRRWAMLHIMQRGDPAQMAKIRGMIDWRQESAPLNRALAAEAARVLNDRDSRDALIAARNDPVNYVRRQAVRSLGYLGTNEDGPLIARALAKDDDEDVRLQAVDSLVQLTQQAAIPDLIAALEDRSQSVRFAAHINLVTLTGVDRGFSRQLWLNWLEPAPVETKK